MVSSSGSSDANMFDLVLQKEFAENDQSEARFFLVDEIDWDRVRFWNSILFSHLNDFHYMQGFPSSANLRFSKHGAICTTIVSPIEIEAETYACSYPSFRFPSFRFSKIPNPLNPIESKSLSFRLSSTLHPIRPIVEVAELQHSFFHFISRGGLLVIDGVLSLPPDFN